MLKMHADVLVDIAAQYERLSAMKEKNAAQLQSLKNQILYVLAAMKKANHE